jgi:hypothetical protein
MGSYLHASLTSLQFRIIIFGSILSIITILERGEKTKLINFFFINLTYALLSYNTHQIVSSS